ncbi:hypothetical protein Tco_0779448 [Tanacetum coccineum]
MLLGRDLCCWAKFSTAAKVSTAEPKLVLLGYRYCCLLPLGIILLRGFSVNITVSSLVGPGCQVLDLEKEKDAQAGGYLQYEELIKS